MTDEDIKACLAFAGHKPEEKIAAETLRRFAGAVQARTIIECADKCEQRANSLREGSAIARQCARDIRNGVLQEPKP